MIYGIFDPCVLDLFDFFLLLILESQYFTIGLVYDPLNVWTFYDVSVTWVNKG